MSRQIFALGLALTLVFTTSLCHASGRLSEQCPGAAQWRGSHPDESESALALRDKTRTLSEPALAAQLMQRLERDQRARVEWIQTHGNRYAGRAVASVDADNLNWLRDLIRKQGFPTAQQVGLAGVHHAWLLLQHADDDPTLQAAMVATLEQRYRDGELPANDLARLTDRVLLAQHQAQRYGTQFPRSAWMTNRFELPAGTSVSEIDANRAKLGLMPLADYACMMSVSRKGLP
jgi:hypothetical protein